MLLDEVLSPNESLADASAAILTKIDAIEKIRLRKTVTKTGTI